jgi:hypothetical protein
VAILILGSLQVLGTPLDDRIAELKHAMEKEAAAKADGAAAMQGGFRNPAFSPAFIAAGIDQVIAQMQNPAYGGNGDAQLAQITAMFTSEEVQEATTNLLAEIHKERKDAADAETASMKALLQRAAEQVNKAKKPEDLDDLLTEMGKHEGNRFGGGAMPGNQELAQQFSAAFEFVKQWQNYLAHLANGQIDLARNDLQSLSQNNNVGGIIPRSKLLELAAPEKMAAASGSAPASAGPTPASQAQAILDGIKTLDDIAPALAKLEPLRQGNMSEVQNAYNSLTQMLQNYQSLKAGLPTQVNLNAGYGAGPSIPAELRAQLLVLALQSRFTSFQGKAPAPTEKPVDFVNRVIDDAVSRGDWDLLRSAAEARGSLAQTTGYGYAMPYTGGIDNLIAGVHQETAGQFALAVQSYETALKSNDPAVPAKIIGDKLAAIQRDHPREFADGMQLVTSPPAPRVYQGATPGMPYGANPPGYPANYQSAQIPPTLLSPAANSNAAPVAPPAK